MIRDDYHDDVDVKSGMEWLAQIYESYSQITYLC